MRALYTSYWHIFQKTMEKNIEEYKSFIFCLYKIIKNKYQIFKTNTPNDKYRFAFLDEDSLETALNTLNLLQNGGKMLGVIFHVEALKERIPLQLKVVPKGDGTSLVEMD